MLGRVVLRLPSIPRIDGSLRARLQTLTNRFRINGIGRRENSPPDCLLTRLTATLDIGLDVGRRHEADLVAEPGQFPRPEMRPGTGLHADQAGCQRAEESQHLSPPQLAPHNRLPVRTDGVNLRG